MKAALVYTSTTPELIEVLEKEVRRVLPADAEIISYEDPSILREIRDAGYVTPRAAARRVAREMKRQVEVIEVLAEGGFGLNQEEFRRLMLRSAEKAAEQADVILLAQGSMAYCEGFLQEQCGKTVVSSPRFGAEALAAALKQKGLM